MILSIVINVITGVIAGVFGLIAYLAEAEWIMIISQLITSILSLAFIPFTLSANAVMYKELVLEQESTTNE